MASLHSWNFFRVGCFDQVQLNSGADLLALKELDEKLWLSLSCPTRSIEFDSRIDANGWAINAMLLANIPFGTTLTSLAHLPKGENHSLIDPFADKKTLWPYYLAIVLGICALIGLWYFGFFGIEA